MLIRQKAWKLLWPNYMLADLACNAQRLHFKTCVNHLLEVLHSAINVWEICAILTIDGAVKKNDNSITQEY